MRIKVLRNYGGRATEENRILPGEYDMSDPALFGAGHELLSTGEAIEIGVIVPMPESEPPQENGWERYTKVALLEVAEQHGLNVSTNMNKAVIITVLEEGIKEDS